MSEITPLPQRQMFVAFMVQMCEALNITVLFPYIAFMVEDFGPPYNTDENLGDMWGYLRHASAGHNFSVAGRGPKRLIGLGEAYIFGTLGVALAC